MPHPEPDHVQIVEEEDTSLPDNHAGRPFVSAFRSWVSGEGIPVEDPDLLMAGEGLDAPARQSSSTTYHIRKAFISTLGFAVPTARLIRLLAGLGPIVEIGAGSGYLSRLIVNEGGDAIATDIDPSLMPPFPTREHPSKTSAPMLRAPWCDIMKMPGAEAVRAFPGRAVLCSWPSYRGTWLTEATKAMQPGQILAVIGEGEGGCTASDCFFDLIGREVMRHPGIDASGAVWQFPGINDHLSVFLRT